MLYAIILGTVAMGIVLLATGDTLIGVLCLVGTAFTAIGTYRLRRFANPS